MLDMISLNSGLCFDKGISFKNIIINMLVYLLLMGVISTLPGQDKAIPCYEKSELRRQYLCLFFFRQNYFGFWPEVLLVQMEPYNTKVTKIKQRK